MCIEIDGKSIQTTVFAIDMVHSYAPKCSDLLTCTNQGCFLGHQFRFFLTE